MKRKEPKWMKECRAEASVGHPTWISSAEAFIAGAEWLSRWLVSRRVSKGGKARAKALSKKERKEIARMGGEARGEKSGNS
jgi:hypothetical protein